MVLFCFAWIAFCKYLKECVYAYASKKKLLVTRDVEFIVEVLKNACKIQFSAWNLDLYTVPSTLSVHSWLLI